MLLQVHRYPDGNARIAFIYRWTKRDAEDVLGQASQVESITRQNALTLDTATPFQHWRLLTDEDLQRWFPRRSGPLRYAPRALTRHQVQQVVDRARVMGASRGASSVQRALPAGGGGDLLRITAGRATAVALVG